MDWGLPHLIYHCEIVAMELAAGALSESAFRLTLSHDSATLRIAVEDAEPRLTLANAGLDSKRGFAKFVSIASDWGCDVTSDGKTVWAERAL